MKSELEQLRKEFNNRIDELQRLFDKPSYKVGAWNKDTTCPIRVFITEVNKNGSLKGYGLGISGKWHQSNAWYNENSEKALNLIPMTESEITEMLNAECKKRGIVDGAMIENPKEWDFLHDMVRINTLNSFDVEYDRHNDLFFIDYFLVYKKGQFAKVVNDEPKEIKKHTYKVGAWNKDTTNGIRVFITEVNESGSLKGYGFGISGNWFQRKTWYTGNKEETLNLMPMTHEEIIDMLTAECKKRGIVNGATVDRPKEWDHLLGVNRVVTLFSREVGYERHNDRFFINHFLVYNCGQFAKVVKNEPKSIKVNGLFVEYKETSLDQIVNISSGGLTMCGLKKSEIETILKNFPDNK